MVRTEIDGSQAKNLSLTADVTGTLPVANGGTGAATLTSNAVLLGNGTGALQTVAAGTSGRALVSNGTTWGASASSAELQGNKNVANGYVGMNAQAQQAVGSEPFLELNVDFTTKSNGNMPTTDDSTTKTFNITYTESNANPQISSGAYVCPDTAASTQGCYYTAPLTAGVTYLECDFQFASAGTGGQALALVVWSNALPTGLLDAASATATAHIVFVPGGYQASYYNAGVQGTVSPNYQWLPGTAKQHVEVAIDVAGDLGPPNTVYVRGADGAVNSFTWAGIAGWTNYQHACCEIRYNTASTDGRVNVYRFAATSTPLKNFYDTSNKARMLVQQGQPGRDIVVMGGVYNLTRAAGQVTDPAYLAYPRPFARVRYCATNTTQASTHTWKLTDRVSGSDVSNSSGTFGASGRTLDVIPTTPFSLATNAMPYCNISTLGASPGIGAAGYLVPG